MNTDELTPNQIRDREEHAKAVERWGGEMPHGDQYAKRSAGFVMAVHRQRKNIQFTNGQAAAITDSRWKDMGTKRLYPVSCKICGVKFHHEIRSTKRCIGCRHAARNKR